MTAPASPPALQLESICKSFRRDTGETVLALDSISFSVPKGGLAALVGPDGAGKTTLIRLLAGLMKADGGAVTVLGIDVARNPQAVQSRISYMPQKFGLYDDLTVLENLDLYADLHGVTVEEKRSQYSSLMEMTGLDPFQKRLAGKLSGGMKQKLGLACTLVRSPELLLLDEPTVGVDPLSRRELWEIIRRLVKEGMTVLISSSFLEEADACETVLVLNEGKKLAEGRPKDVSSLALGRTFLSQSWTPCQRAGKSGSSAMPHRADPSLACSPARRHSRRLSGLRMDSWCSCKGRDGQKPTRPVPRRAARKKTPQMAPGAAPWLRCMISIGVSGSLSRWTT